MTWTGTLEEKTWMEEVRDFHGHLIIYSVFDVNAI